MAHVKLLYRWSSPRRTQCPPTFQRKLKNCEGWEGQSVLQHCCTFKKVTAVWHDALLALFFQIFITMQNSLLPFKLPSVAPLQGEAVVALCGSLFLLDIPIVALYGTNTLGRQFSWSCLMQWMIFHCEVLALSDNNSSWVLLINRLDHGWWAPYNHSGCGSESFRTIANVFICD